MEGAEVSGVVACVSWLLLCLGNPALGCQSTMERAQTSPNVARTRAEHQTRTRNSSARLFRGGVVKNRIDLETRTLALRHGSFTRAVAAHGR